MSQDHVDDVLDTLKDALGKAGSTRTWPEEKTCPDCGRTYYNAGAHSEECSGRPPTELEVRRAREWWAARARRRRMF